MKNNFEVINQLRISTDYSHHRFDVILLINGVPVTTIHRMRLLRLYLTNTICQAVTLVSRRLLNMQSSKLIPLVTQVTLVKSSFA